MMSARTGALCLPAGAWLIIASVAHAQAPVNIEVLQGVSGEDLAAIMEVVNTSLGVECEHCHVPGSFAADDLAAKETARAMMRMLVDLDSTTFELLESPSCWTCHRGAVTPESVPPPLLVPPDIPFAPFSGSQSPSGEVYENVQVLGSLPADQLMDTMASYTRALGVGCDRCHVVDDWASDEKIEKSLTRVMIGMQRSLPSRFGPELDAVTCWTCHRGEPTPRTNLPAGLLPL